MSPLPASLFVGTFNLNGTIPSRHDASRWLRSHGAEGADVVFLSLQECPIAGVVRNEDRSDGSDNDSALLSALLGALSPLHELAADVSMGEPPTGSKFPSSNGAWTEWYGFVRILLFARGGE